MNAEASPLVTSSTRRWAITVVATVASTYALDAVATATGLALAASGILGGVASGPLLAVLAATYVLWAAGLRASLAANWALLEATGTSTNALSKAAYDVAGRRRVGPRARRAAAGVGYVGTEVAKEIPYYVGAFAAALSDPVTSADALIFLGGANAGAAAYEFALARGTRAVLRRRPSRNGA